IANGASARRQCESFPSQSPAALDSGEGRVKAYLHSIDAAGVFFAAKHQSRLGLFSVDWGDAFCTIYTDRICVGPRPGCFRAGAETGAASRQIRRASARFHAGKIVYCACPNGRFSSKWHLHFKAIVMYNMNQIRSKE
ncbi:MAG: hypothetical protein IKQ17_04540, partial [Kiritimatiellae bacterium]|nr:hypothetical protein [Kiritimatiellia bacterium]